MAMTKQQFAELLEPKLRKVFFEEYSEIPEQYTEVFHVEKSKKAEEHDFHVAGLGMWDKFNGAVEYDDYAPGDKVTYTHETYAKGISIPWELAEDDLYNVVGPRGDGTKKTKSLARGARARVETLAAEVLNNAFSTNGYDGVPLCSDSHPLIGGGTQDNLMTDALSEAALKTGRLMMRRQVDDRGLKIQASADTLVVPADLEYLALELTQADKKPQTDYNDPNVVGKRIKKVVVMDYLTDSNNWFLLDSTLHQLNFFWRVRPEFHRDTDIDHFNLKFVGRMRFSVGYSDYRGIVGSNVA